ncbi:MAG: hypothetical protein JSS79_11280 [Bacteroidetes bacterium]|nr:hypothetical protein [Bacteroidota bacterium]
MGIQESKLKKIMKAMTITLVLVCAMISCSEPMPAKKNSDQALTVEATDKGNFMFYDSADVIDQMIAGQDDRDSINQPFEIVEFSREGNVIVATMAYAPSCVDVKFMIAMSNQQTLIYPQIITLVAMLSAKHCGEEEKSEHTTLRIDLKELTDQTIDDETKVVLKNLSSAQHAELQGQISSIGD